MPPKTKEKAGKKDGPTGGKNKKRAKKAKTATPADTNDANELANLQALRCETHSTLFRAASVCLVSSSHLALPLSLSLSAPPHHRHHHHPSAARLKTDTHVDYQTRLKRLEKWMATPEYKKYLTKNGRLDYAVLNEHFEVFGKYLATHRYKKGGKHKSFTDLRKYADAYKYGAENEGFPVGGTDWNTQCTRLLQTIMKQVAKERSEGNTDEHACDPLPPSVYLAISMWALESGDLETFCWGQLQWANCCRCIAPAFSSFIALPSRPSVLLMPPPPPLSLSLGSAANLVGLRLQSLSTSLDALTCRLEVTKSNQKYLPPISSSSRPLSLPSVSLSLSLSASSSLSSYFVRGEDVQNKHLYSNPDNPHADVLLGLGLHLMVSWEQIIKDDGCVHLLGVFGEGKHSHYPLPLPGTSFRTGKNPPADSIRICRS